MSTVGATTSRADTPLRRPVASPGPRVGGRRPRDLDLAVAGCVAAYRRPELVDTGTVLAAFAQVGLTNRTVLAIVGLLAPMLACSATGLVIFWRRSNDRTALLFPGMLITIGASVTRSLFALRRCSRR